MQIDADKEFPTPPESYWKTASNSDFGDLIFISVKYYNRMDTDEWTVKYRFAYEEAVISTKASHVVTGDPKKRVPDHNKRKIDKLPGYKSDVFLQSEYGASELGYNQVIPGANKYTPSNFYEKHPDPEETPYWKTYINQLIEVNSNSRHICSINPKYKPEITVDRI